MRGAVRETCQYAGEVLARAPGWAIHVTGHPTLRGKGGQSDGAAMVG